MTDQKFVSTATLSLSANARRPILAITCGEPAGVGPEISIKAAWELRADINSVLIGDAAFLAMIAAEIDPAIKLVALSEQAFLFSGLPNFGPDRIAVIDSPFSVHVQPGKLDPRNGRAILKTLDIAIAGAAAKSFDGIVTAPLQKSTINDAGVHFTGHTEYLAEKTGTAQVVMMLATDRTTPPLRVALATTHLALKDVAAAITTDSLSRTLDILYHDLQTKFGIAQPRIMVTGLNPHAGEGGYLGREEIEIITPVLAAAKAKGMLVSGPYPADTLFQQKYLDQADCVLAMYHDQGLPVLKYASFGHGINITLGLPIIRTSVDHGTALDLAAAGLGKADHGSMLAALHSAAQMVRATATSDAVGLSVSTAE
ncbi:4-hydroxythreonine-4-phosphate dehydrogenase PdxA [Glaciimonas sp. CA11.2]|uniref:4-hydroxythreonine-4-phosphate dehydrogenase PdxA n=1 Tax=Glaciimonas sp. CA11.2 TaxID=3048601 RepID=UPI002AB3C7A0|nr:4-hydroxythreonine-4-phosphate dehydrogenase PdxA [Glaciimonas sp. CA11.2]MDY7545147.1 4-hydroxythreonine-4-phosphate dehydrogenase PdxA [Glaciimonas sp. CA11.2]MEB0162882.1 4-hydroxythreonine-4-phosphate dehydrogenase PdxA [Glaciimonas sp. CA11.2]